MLVSTSPEDFLRSLDEAKAERRRVKTAERSLEDRPLDPWERYRALIDYYHALQDLSEQGDRKTRFALLILGSINAINLLIVTRGDVVGLAQHAGPGISIYVACYTLLSLGVFLYAIAALRPQTRQSHDGSASADTGPLWSPDGPLAQSFEGYSENWRQSHVGQLNGELTSIVYRTAEANAARGRSLGRVYLGLYVLVALTASLLVALALPSLT